MASAPDDHLEGSWTILNQQYTIFFVVDSNWHTKVKE